jgi:hypothetical protein
LPAIGQIETNPAAADIRVLDWFMVLKECPK